MTSHGANGQSFTDDDSCIMEPREVDVLCGRGGMSNHHPGNEWYRRLIRSNRPLYRACPKHTKLLVAKAIVQAVQQQSGRFLERDKKTGYFYKVTYKRAVDKTSQGLRERERDCSGSSSNSDSGDHKAKKKKSKNNEEDDDNNYESDDFDDGFEEEYKGEVPDGFRGTRDSDGRLEPPNLTALASVAIENTRNAALKASSKSSGFRNDQKLDTPSMSSSPKAVDLNSNSKNGRSESYANDGSIAALNKRQKINNSNQPYNPRNILQQTTHVPITSLEPTESSVSLAPLPPSLAVHESSMFRGLLKHTKLLPGASMILDQSNVSSSPWSVTGSGNLSNLKRPLGLMSTEQQHISSQFKQPPQRFPQNQQNLKTAMNLGPGKNQDLTNNFAPLKQSNDGSRQFHDLKAADRSSKKMETSSTAPALTRLTTQVSDWLKNSFWPLNSSAPTDTQDEDLNSNAKKAGDAEAPPTRRAAVLQAQKVAASIPPPLPKPKQQQPKGRKKQADFELILSHNQQELHLDQEYGQGQKQHQFTTNQPQQQLGLNEKMSLFQQRQYQSNSEHGQRMSPYDSHHQIQQQRQFSSLSVIQQNQSQGQDFAVPKTINKRKSSVSLPPLPYFNGPSESTFSLFSTFSAKNIELDEDDLGNMVNPSTHNTYGGTHQYRQPFSVNPSFSPVNNTNQFNDDDSDDPLMGNDDDTGTLPRTELEQSVSTTLLKLAGSTPSLLLSGLTSFFERGGHQSRSLTQQQQSKGNLLEDSGHGMPSLIPGHTNGLGAVMPQFGGMLGNGGGGGINAVKKPKASLLDDYEESPMEARLREISWRN